MPLIEEVVPSGEEHTSDPQARGGDLLLLAVRYNKEDVLRRIIQSRWGKSLNETDTKTGWTPLMWACYYRSSPKICSELLKSGADPNVTDPQGLSAVHWAAYHGPAETCRLMLQHGGDTAKRSLKGATSLMLAAKAGREDVMRCLLSDAAALKTLNDADALGRTALFFAVSGGHVDTVRLLLSRGADFTLPADIRDLSGGICLRLVEAAERAYLLHKVRTIQKQELDRRERSEGFVPLLLMKDGERSRPRQSLVRVVPQESESAPSAVLDFVMKDLCPELFVELLGFIVHHAE